MSIEKVMEESRLQMEVESNVQSYKFSYRRI